MKKLSRSLVRVGMALAFAAPQAQAGVIVSLTPDSAMVTLGDTLDVDVLIAGLRNFTPPSVGAFDLDVSFDAAILSPTGVTFGPFLGDPDPFAFETFTDFQFLTGVVDFAEVSLLSPAELDGLQPSGFRLATLSFDAIATGVSPLMLTQISVDDPFGVNLIPEPRTLWLIGVGLAGLGRVSRRRCC